MYKKLVFTVDEMIKESQREYSLEHIKTNKDYISFYFNKNEVIRLLEDGDILTYPSHSKTSYETLRKYLNLMGKKNFMNVNYLNQYHIFLSNKGILKKRQVGGVYGKN